ncbi:MAG: hypothetical protein JXR12_05135 [Neptunomonas phycophila]|uniref:hypothetical protein n=1 Tax=Neptunomonas phycophila TaxID=1572645 RepID=UPI003B8D29D8
MRTPSFSHEYLVDLEDVIEYKRSIFAEADRKLNAGKGIDMSLVQFHQDLGAEIHKLEIEYNLLKEGLEQ